MKYKWIILIVALLAGLVFGVAKAQNDDCILVYNDDDEPGYYDELYFTDAQGRDICKVRVVFHDPVEGDPTGATFTESGSQNGYSANFDGASVHVWRSGSPYSISHSKVWVHQPVPTDTPVPPTEIPPTSTATPTDVITDPPPITNTPETPTPTGTIATPTPTSTITITLTATPTMTGTLPTPFITETPPETPNMPPVSYPPPMLPETGVWGINDSNIPLYLGIAFLCIVAIIFARKMRIK